MEAAGLFLRAIAIGLAGGAVGLLLIWLGMKLAGGNHVLGTEVLLFAVVIATAVTNAVSDDAGLVSAVVMGMAAPLVVGGQIEEVKPFFATIVNASIGILFISISALVTPESLQGLVLPCLGMVAALVLVVRPLTALLLTVRGDLTFQQRLYIGWMAPRGIVAASTAASFSAALLALGIPDAEYLLPVTFLVIVGTVVFYSATAVPMAGLLKLRESKSVPSASDLPAEMPGHSSWLSRSVEEFFEEVLLALLLVVLRIVTRVEVVR
jgi:NhaP-type Na+/H+ or K+/H+ antiporter